MRSAVAGLAVFAMLGTSAETAALSLAARSVENVKSWVMPRLTASIRSIGENEARHFDCVMVGDSITEGWLQKRGMSVQRKMLGDFSILNLGISGDTTGNVLWRFDQGVLDGYTADLFQIMIGSNNGGEDSPDDMKAAVGEIIRRIRAKHPESKVLLLPIFYVRGGRTCRANVSRDKRNAKLKELADGETVVWHDFNARFYDQPDNISTNVFYDGQHPNVRAHEIWAEEVRPFIEKAVAEAKAKRRTVTVEVGPGADLSVAIREVNAKRKPGDRGEIVLADGTYPLSTTVELGSEASFITIRAKNPGKAVIVGGEVVRGADFRIVTDEHVLKRLPVTARGKARAYRPTGALKRAFEEGRHAGGGNWTYRDWNNYAANKPKGKKDFGYPTFPCLTVDVRRQELARWPNGRDWCWIGASNLVYTAKDGKNARIVTGTGREKGWTFANQKIAAAGWINAWRYLNWCTDVTRAEGSDELVLAESKINTTYARTYFFNIPEEMDEPGEWCYDGTSGQVLLFPPEGFGDESVCAFGTTKDILFHVTGDGISIRDLVVTSKVFHPAVVIENDAAGNEIRGCRFSGIGYDCIWMAGRRNVVRDCDLEDIVSMGIGVQGGDVKTMLPHLNRVENNVIRRAELLCTTWAKSGIYVDGVGNYVAHNEVTDMVDGGIYFAGYGHILEYNRVYDVCREFDDVGSVYSPGGGRCYGNVFRYNDISGAPGQGVVLYYDDTTSGHEAYGNILRNAGHNAILVGGGRDNNIHDNLIIGGFTGIEMDNRGLHWPAYTKRSEEEMRRSFAEKWNLTNRTEAICRKYPKFAAWLTSPLPLYSYAGNRFERNVIVDPAGYASVLVIGKDKTIDSTNTVFSGNVVYRTRGPQAGRDLVLHPENVATNECSARVPVRPPIGECRVVDGMPEKPLDLGFADLPPPAFDPWPYMGYAPQNWVDRAQLYALRRENFKSMSVKRWRKGDLTLKPGSMLDREAPGLRSIPFDKIGPQREERAAECQ